MDIIYKNRYNQDLLFSKDEDQITVTGYSGPIRTGYNATGTRLDFVDPAGGPWLHVGMGLGIIDSSLKNKKVDHIRFEEDHILLTTSNIK